MPIEGDNFIFPLVNGSAKGSQIRTSDRIRQDIEGEEHRSVAILAQAILAQSRALSVQVNIVAVSDHVFHRFASDLLIQVSATQLSKFLCFSFVLMATDRTFEDAVHTTLPGSPAQLSSNVASPYGSTPDLEKTGQPPRHDGGKINEIYLQLPLFLQNASRIENCFQTLSQTVAQTTKIARIEQIVGSLLARVTTLETGAASGSSDPDSARSWNIFGHSDGSTATGSLGSHGPGSSDDNRRRLDTFSSPADEHARSAVFLRFPCEQCQEGVSAWIEKIWATTDATAFSKPIRIHCKTGSLSARLVFETRAKYFGLLGKSEAPLPSQNACATFFAQSSVVPFLNVRNCCIRTKRYYQVMRTTSHSYEMV